MKTALDVAAEAGRSIAVADSGTGSPSKANGSGESDLIRRCLEGEEAAWEKLYFRYHPALEKAIKHLLRDRSGDFDLSEEIASRVWYELLRNEARLLARFESSKGARLDTFLGGLARIEILRYLRAERRRRSHEWKGGQRTLESYRVSEADVAAYMGEFTDNLTPSERRFFEDYLLDTPRSDADSEALSPASVWQRRHRLRRKFRSLFE